MPDEVEVTLTTLFGDGEYTAEANQGSYTLANQNTFSYSLVKYIQDQGQNPSNNSAFRLVLDSPPDAIASASISGFFTQGFPEKDCAPNGGWNCSEFTPVTADIFGKPSVNTAGKVFFPLKNHDDGAYVQAAAKCPCNDSTKSRRFYAQIGVTHVGSGAYVLIVDLNPCTNCGAEPEEVTRKQQQKPAYKSSSMVERIDESFALLRAWNEHKI